MIRELIDTDLEAVAGGYYDFTAIGQFANLQNTATQTASASGQGPNTAVNAIGVMANGNSQVAAILK